MTFYTTLHLHNVTPGREEEYASWFDGRHRQSLAQLRGLCAAERYQVAEAQFMAAIPQPWSYLSVYDFDLESPEIDLPALAPLLAEARDAGLILGDETERLYSFQLFSDWRASPNIQPSLPFSGVSVLIGNITPGRAAEYHKWYDELHGHEVSNVPGVVAIRRGELASTQLEPRRYCPGDQLAMMALQSDNVKLTTKDFIDRALGRSPSRIAMEPRSSAASTARTIHLFTKISGREFWPGGIAYAGDLSVYPGYEDQH
jgi:hypothetical protein